MHGRGRHALPGNWVHQRLEGGAQGLHVQARERFDPALLEVVLQFTRGRRAEVAARLGAGRSSVTRKTCKFGPSRRRR